MHTMHNIENNRSQHSQDIRCLRSIYFTFHVTFLVTILPPSIYHIGPNQSNQSSQYYLPLHLLMHRASSRSYITFRVPHNSPRASSIFLFSQPISKTPNIKGKTRNKQEENHGKPTTIHHHNQTGMAMHKMQKKLQSSIKNHQNTKITRLTIDTMTQSPWFTLLPRESST